MYCRNCGKEIKQDNQLCPHCGQMPTSGEGFCHVCGYAVDPAFELCIKCGAKLVKLAKPESRISPKSRTVVTILTIFPGFIGVAGIHRFYIGKTRTGVIMLLTLGGLGVWTLIDYVTALTGKMKDAQGKPVKKW